MKALSGRETILLIAVVALVVVLALTTPFVFHQEGDTRIFKIDTPLLVLADTAMIFIGAVGMTLVILSGQIDLSVSSMLAVCAAITAHASQTNLPTPVVFLIPIVVGTIIGAINGSIVAYGRIHSIIVTLGMLALLQGVAIHLLPKGIVHTSDAFKAIGSASLLQVPSAIWIAAAFTLIVAFFVRNTRLGREFYAVGSNNTAAAISGINVQWIQFLAMTFMGFSMGLASAVYISRYGVVTPPLGQGLNLRLITAVVIGGTSIFGGLGTVKGTLLAVMFISLVSRAMVYYHLPSVWEQAVYGSMLLLAVGTDIIRTQARPRIRTGEMS